MPHRTVFQVGKNHVHPFTMFLGGVVVGSIATGTIAWVWAQSDQTDINITNSVVPHKSTKKSTTSASPSVQPSASPTASF